jgi:hypothetical protein
MENGESQKPIVTIDTKTCHYPYAHFNQNIWKEKFYLRAKGLTIKSVQAVKPIEVCLVPDLELQNYQNSRNYERSRKVE